MAKIKEVKNYRDTEHLFNSSSVSNLDGSIVWLYEKVFNSRVFSNVDVEIISWLYGSKIPKLTESLTVDEAIELVRPFADSVSGLMIRCKCDCAPVKIKVDIEDSTVMVNVRKINTADINIIAESLSLHD